MPLTGISVYTDKQFLDELHERMKRGAIKIELLGQSDTHSRIRLVGFGRDGAWGFETAAFPPKVEHTNG